MKIVSFVLLTCFSCGLAYGQAALDIPVHLSAKTFTVNTVNKDNGNKVSESTAGVSISKGAVDIRTHEERGEGKDMTVTESVRRYRIDNNSMYPVSSLTKVIKGQYIISETELIFGSKKAKYIHKDHPKNKTQTKEIELKPDMLQAQDIWLYFAEMIRSGDKERSFSIIIPTGDGFRMKAAFSGRTERIKVQGTEKMSVKVAMKPDLGLISAVIGDAYFWFDAEPPHGMLRYEGLERGPGSPVVVQEVSVEKKGETNDK